MIDGSKMGVPGGGQQTDMPQDALQFDQINAFIEQMGGRIDGDTWVIPDAGK